MSNQPLATTNTIVTTVAQNRTVGEDRRRAVTRGVHGAWSPPANRPDPVQALLEANVGLLPDLLPIKWTRMAASPFGFFRGAAALMAQDLAGYPVTGLNVQICGDARVHNLGAYAAPDGHLVFDLNDFDETLADAPWEWDVKRLATSLILADREAGGQNEAGVEAVHEGIGWRVIRRIHRGLHQSIFLSSLFIRAPAFNASCLCGKPCGRASLGFRMHGAFSFHTLQ